MSQIGCTSKDKARFDELKPDDMTQAEFFETVLDAYENRDKKVVIDTDEIIAEINHGVVTEAEIACYRGTKEAIEEIELWR